MSHGGKKTRTEQVRGFTDDGEDIPVAIRFTTQQKVSFLNLMLGQSPITALAGEEVHLNAVGHHQKHQTALLISDDGSPFH